MFEVYGHLMPFRKTKFRPGEHYHVFNRGFCKMKIFERDCDAKLFSSKAVEFSNKFDVSIKSSAMMNNHFHYILVQSLDNNGIQKMMYHLQMVYARRFNKKHKRRGQVFEGRFKAKLIDNDYYHRNIFNYVFWNPLK